MPWSGGWERTAEEKQVCDRLEKVQGEVGAKSLTAGTYSCSLTAPHARNANINDSSFVVAIAYVLHKAPFVFPIVGGRKPEQLLANVEALEISLTAEQIAYLDGAKPVDLGFPGFLIVRTFLVCTKLGRILICD